MKVLAIVQARMGSNRLPGKVMKVLGGYPMIYHTLTKLQRARYVDQVILATSNKEADTPLAEYAASIGFEVFRGDEDNVLERYKQTSELYEGDIIIRVTGDCPLLDTVIVDHVITNYLIADYDYMRLDVPNTFIRGFDVEVFSKEALDRAYEIVSHEVTTEDPQCQMYSEHVTYYMYTHPETFKVEHVKGYVAVDPQYNLSVDTIEDFERASRFIHEQGYRSILNKVKKEFDNH